MKRNQLLQCLNNYVPTNEEAIYKSRMLAFILDNPECFERSLEIGHITASAWLLNKDHSRVLLMHHAKLNLWVQLGGHCDGESDVLAVAIKEAQEESGIDEIAPVSTEIFDIDIHLIPANKKEKEHYHYDVRFLLAVNSNDSFVQNSESKELKWFGMNDELPTESRSIARMVEKWKRMSLIKPLAQSLKEKQ
ncbi:MAG TPA: NUDIX hydrolase [Candidatus Babeliales bacterium]|nr:NUDIX hydrolase [Candidatus Babeliales bacterium]